MTYEEADALCEQYGYALVCWSPLEVMNESGDICTGAFALDILEELKELKERGF